MKKKQKKKKVKKFKAISFNASPVVYDESLPKGILDQKKYDQFLSRWAEKQVSKMGLIQMAYPG